MNQSLLAGRPGDTVPPGPTASPHLADDAPLPHAPLAAFPGAGRKSRAAWLWGASSAVLSGLGFVALALFEQYNGMVSEMRTDLKHFNETQSNFVKREYF